MQEILNSIIKHISIIGSFIILSSLLKIYLYYKFFNIPVINFIELSEAVILFVDNLLAYFTIFIVTIFVTLLLEINIGRFFAIDNLSEFSSLRQFLLFLKSNIFLLIVIILLTVGSFLYYLLRRDIHFYEFLILSGFVWIFYYILPFFLLVNKDRISFNMEFQSILLILILSSMLIYAVLGAWDEYYKVKEKKYYSGSEFIIDGKSVKSTDSVYFVGKTKNYVFFYDQDQKASTIIPSSKVEKYTFK